MLSAKIKKALNEQLNKELYSYYLYLAMSGFFEFKGLKGCANWMRVQGQEELAHMMKYYAYIFDRKGHVDFLKLDAPPSNWKSIEAVFQAAYDHEVLVTQSIHKIVDMAIDERDHATSNFLQWFVAEQVEEESSVLEVLDKLKMAKGSDAAILFLDRELGQRAQG